MSQHDHRTAVPGCYRCELGQDEARAARQEAVEEAQAAWLRYRDHPDQRWMKRRQMRRRDFIAGYLANEWSQ